MPGIDSAIGSLLPQGVQDTLNQLEHDHPAVQLLHQAGHALQYLIPVYGQHLAAQEENQRRVDASYEDAVLQASLDNPEIMDSPDFQKIASKRLGPLSQPFIGVIGAISKRHKAQQGAYAADLNEAMQLHPDDPASAFGESFVMAHTRGHDIPAEAQKAYMQAVYAGPVARQKATAAAEGKLGVMGSPEALDVATRKATAVGGAAETARQDARKPYQDARDARRDAAATQRGEASYQRQLKLIKERAKQALSTKEQEQFNSILGDKAKGWRNKDGVQPEANMSIAEAVAQGFAPINPSTIGWWGKLTGKIKKPKTAGTAATPTGDTGDSGSTPPDGASATTDANGDPIDAATIDAAYKSLPGLSTTTTTPTASTTSTTTKSPQDREAELIGEIKAGHITVEQAAETLKREYGSAAGG